MGRALIIGCGGVASVAIHKCCQNSEVFTDIMIASRTKEKCDALKAKLDTMYGGKTNISTAKVNADSVPELVALMKEYKPDVCLNLALPYQDLTIMDACLECKVHYIDTANYEPEDTAKFEYKWQWAYREKFEKAWGVKLDPNIGTHATDVFPKAITGEIKGLYIYGEDPVVTDPDTTHIIKALKSLDFFVLQELFMTETAQYADVILPGVSYAEKEGTFTNTERRVQRVRKAVTVPGEMRLDTDIIIDLMNRMGYPQPHLTSAQIMDEIASLTPSFAGISHERLDSEEVHGQGLQWPCTSKDHPGTPIMHVGKFSRGLGWFYPAKYVPSAELPDDDYPIILMTGRILYHYTTRAMTGKTPELMEIEGKSFIEMNIVDADKLSIKNGDKVRVSSRRGSIESTARVGTKTSPGESWMPFHFPDGNANWLTNAALDKYARIPEYKVCAIKIEKA